MTKEQEALYFFKEYTLLQLKSFLVEKAEKLSAEEIEIIKQAIEFYRTYNHLKLAHES